MEKNLFSWEDWDEAGPGSFFFYNAVLKVDIGQFKSGTKFDSIFVNWEKNTLEFTNFEKSDDETQTFHPEKFRVTFNLSLQVGEEVSRVGTLNV